MTMRILSVPVSGTLDKKTTSYLRDKGSLLKECRSELAPSLIRHFDPHAVLAYVDRSGLSRGLEFLKILKGDYPDLPVIFISPANEVEIITQIMKAGAADYLSEPLDLDKLQSALSKLARQSEPSPDEALKSRMSLVTDFEGLVGVSTPMQDIFQMIKTVAKSNATVLILGESGTGKELVAKAVHNRSDRSRKRFIDINCGAIPKELLENELFGHERGSFTGADRMYQGSCERADGGTLFLDEISEMDPSLQVKLLRILQERAFNRIGGTERIEVDIRIIAATNRDIREEVRLGRFREDLYYRLNVVPISIPPLRARREDIPCLARFFLKLFNEKNQKHFKDFTPEALDVLVNYDWRGNVRELENCIERVVVLHDDTHVRPTHMPKFIGHSDGVMGLVKSAGAGADPFQGIIPLDLVERYAIEAALAKCNGDVATASKKLEIGQATLYRKLKKYGLRS